MFSGLMQALTAIGKKTRSMLLFPPTSDTQTIVNKLHGRTLPRL